MTGISKKVGSILIVMGMALLLCLSCMCTSASAKSSGHNSEYNAWFRKRPDLIEKYCTHGTNWNPGEYAYSVKLRTDVSLGLR